MIFLGCASLCNCFVAYPRTMNRCIVRLIVWPLLVWPGGDAGRVALGQLDAWQLSTERRLDEQDQFNVGVLARMDAETARAKADTKLLRFEIASADEVQDTRIAQIEADRKSEEWWVRGIAGGGLVGLVGTLGWFVRRLVTGFERRLFRRMGQLPPRE